jgi:hypothetical protein
MKLNFLIKINKNIFILENIKIIFNLLKFCRFWLRTRGIDRTTGGINSLGKEISNSNDKKNHLKI